MQVCVCIQTLCVTVFNFMEILNEKLAIIYASLKGSAGLFETNLQWDAS